MWLLSEVEGFLLDDGPGLLVGVLAMIATLWAEKVGVIISGTLKNGGAEKTALIHVAIQHGWRGFFGGVGPGSLCRVSAATIVVW